MLRWLRSAGDKARLDQELQRIGLRPSALPPEMRAQLVDVVQRHTDAIRKFQNPPPMEFQAFFDKAFELAAAVPSVVGTPRDLAFDAVGDHGYTYIIACIKDKDYSSHAPLIQDLCQVCKRWNRHPNPDFDEAMRSQQQ